jgi:protein tyrosine phosphatase (PTP) superfamily phosphohydrolase (DUF442 family)
MQGVSCRASSAIKQRAELTILAITFELIHQLGVSERDYQAYEEMELAGHSVMMHCRKSVRITNFGSSLQKSSTCDVYQVQAYVVC